MKFQPSNYYHVFNQGNNHQKVFLREVYYGLFMDLYQRYVVPHCQTVNYVLMPNHFHFMVYCDERCVDQREDSILKLHPINAGLRQTLSLYSRTVNKYEGRSGSFFRQNTKSKCLEDGVMLGSVLRTRSSYIEECFYYIHKNPIRAGLVTNLADWPHSAYAEYTGVRRNGICSRELAERDCGFSKVDFKERCHSIEKMVS
jgi:putative transposase